MPVIEDDLWKNPGNPGMIVISSNASVDEKGRLYMGSGPGLEAVKRIPDIAEECGRQVQECAVDGVYGFLPIRPFRPEERKIGFGLFQSQIGWDQVADPDLIKYSMERLRAYTNEYNSVKIRMNFPGVGMEGLGVDEVAPLLLPLPSTVTVCHQGEVQPSMPSNFIGFKAIYLEVERMLQEGRENLAIEYMMRNGFDIQSAMEQVHAVDRLMRERKEKEAQHVQSWRRSAY